MIHHINSTPIPGCFEIFPKVFKDARGLFVKTFHKEIFLEHGLETEWAEEYYSISFKGVLRGLHFQLPPHDHNKLVYCPVGKVMDVVVDLRQGSPAFGQHAAFFLDAEQCNMIYIPKGLAHGFYTLTDTSIMMYKVSRVYAPEHDTGILWSSVGIAWPDHAPVMSERDKKFPAFCDFVTPFLYPTSENEKK